ncbi:hypothetical protein SARC_14300, partial [Sphaeroforma arctica JP610]
ESAESFGHTQSCHQTREDQSAHQQASGGCARQALLHHPARGSVQEDSRGPVPDPKVGTGQLRLHRIRTEHEYRCVRVCRGYGQVHWQLYIQAQQSVGSPRVPDMGAVGQEELQENVQAGWRG